MARARSVYRCTECGHEHPKWAGRCEGCGAWNAVAEEPIVIAGGKGAKGAKGASAFTQPQRLRDVSTTPLARWRTGMPELDFVVGGGFVPGSLTLIGGEPGIGKSTLLLQAAGRLEQVGKVVLYASGEESTEQLAVAGGATRRRRRCGARHRGNATRGHSRGKLPPSRPTCWCSTRSRRFPRTCSRVPPGTSARCVSAPASSCAMRRPRARRCWWWDMSPRAAALRVPRPWSTSSTRCSTSRVRRPSTTACSGPPRTGSARSTNSASS